MKNFETIIYNNSKTEYEYNNTRLSNHITTLRNVIYASSLKQNDNNSNEDRKSMQRMIDFNRANSTNDYIEYQRFDNKESKIDLSYLIYLYKITSN